jgi:uncharacterized protein (UPF0212 family)
MDPLTMAGAWAGALLALLAVARVSWKAFERAVRNILREEIQRVHRDMDDIETRFERLEAALEALQQAVTELRLMMFDAVMVLIGALDWTDRQVSSQLVIGGVSLISLILSGYVFAATFDDKWQRADHEPSDFDSPHGGADGDGLDC